MPTYEYICTACEHQWEAEQSMKEDPLTKCPSCSKRTAKRQISGGTGFLLKGGGWYSDLYGSTPPPAGDSDGSDSASSTKSKPESKKTDEGAKSGGGEKSDAKPAAGAGGSKKGSSSKGSAKGS